ncbi:hypothetical protein ACIRFH_24450 [Streptomyces sp. NPDC093586]|uniref:hypothetical protein n=1 Tax=Streptomyces sp. NPDC093586 TaxID=3366042 RepID=UPI00380203EF
MLTATAVLPAAPNAVPDGCPAVGATRTGRKKTEVKKAAKLIRTCAERRKPASVHRTAVASLRGIPALKKAGKC